MSMESSLAKLREMKSRPAPDKFTSEFEQYGPPPKVVVASGRPIHTIKKEQVVAVWIPDKDGLYDCHGEWVYWVKDEQMRCRLEAYGCRGAIYILGAKSFVVIDGGKK